MRFLYNTTTSSSSSTATSIFLVSLYLLVSVVVQQYGSNSISIKHGGSNPFVVEATRTSTVNGSAPVGKAQHQQQHQQQHTQSHQHQHRQLLRTRILEEAEDEDDDEGNDNDNDNDNEDEEEDGDSASEEEENDASNYFGYDTSTGYLLATQCRAYKVEEPDDNLNTILEWNTEYGNGLDFFRVPQQSFVYYSYINGQQQEDQSSSNGDITHYMIDLTDWIATTAISGLGKDSVPSCQQIKDVQGIFHTNDSDDITHYFAITDNNNDDNDEDNADRQLEEDEEEDEEEDGDDNAIDFGDWEPQLYVGPICGMTDGTINIGVFIDDTCTTYVPQWTYRYRNALAQGKIKSATTTTSSDSDSESDTEYIYSSGSYDNTDLTTLGTLDKYTTKQNHHHWKCNSGDGVLCSSLLSYSADTMYCQSSDNDSNDNNEEEEEQDEEEEDNRRRKLEEDANEEEEDNEDGDDNDDGDDGDDDENEDDDESNSNDNNNDYSNNNYQISQEELETMETTCEAVFLSYIYQGQGTLEDYLKKNKQLSNTKNYQKQNRFIVELVVLIMVAFVVFTMTILCQKQRKRRRSNKLQEDDSKIRRRLFGRNSRRSTSRKSSLSNSTTTNTNDDVATVGENSIKTYNTSNSSSSKGRNKKQGRWFSSFRRSKKQTKSSSMYNTRKEKRRNTAMTEKERNLLGSF
mmetsp:Transcript_29279/g.33658  ORF Transcript_29279/g.33658 Transcript_29279/m.33658 type:complete len:687 (+) Transcript_29279:199-2259(+)